VTPSLRLSAALALAATTLAACVRGSRGPAVPPPPPEVQREFRGVWVATVQNIDWPSRPGLSTAEQQRELVALLDRARSLNLNAVVLQVRPATDALYASSLEPWSEYLTGTMGQAPSPYYDPLAFAVAEAHRRGIELHAWFNPYRARQAGAKSPVAANHVSVTRPDLVRRYGALQWMDPGEPETQAHSLAVVLDVVRRYDVDGVHIDDYFYPYKVADAAGRKLDFPDSASYARYVAGGRRARARRLAPRERQPVRPAAVRPGAGGQAVGEGGGEPVRHRAPGAAGGGLLLRPVRRALRRRAQVAARGVARLLDAAALLEDRRAAAELPEAARLLGRRERARPAPVAGQLPVARRDGEGALAGGGDRLADRVHARAARRAPGTCTSA
jgi:hypothetical protein